MAEESPVVCNAGPLIALAMADCLPLLERLYRRVLVPTEVFHEIVGAGAGRIGAQEVEAASWLERLPPSVIDPFLAQELGSGEAAVITAAHRLKARAVLIDERRARRIAEHVYHLQVRGSAGILVAAKRAGFVPAIRPLLESMRRHGYYLSDRLVGAACRKAGE